MNKTRPHTISIDLTTRQVHANVRVYSWHLHRKSLCAGGPCCLVLPFGLHSLRTAHQFVVVDTSDAHKPPCHRKFLTNTLPALACLPRSKKDYAEAPTTCIPSAFRTKFAPSSALKHKNAKLRVILTISACSSGRHTYTLALL